MLRSIYQRIVGAFQTKRSRKAPHRTRSRRLSLESLEGRRLLTTTTLTVNSISDGSFEAPNLTAGDYQIAPPSSAWQYTGIAGVSGKNSGFTNGNTNAPNGSQVAFLKNGGSISQTVTLDAGVYNLSLLAAQRVNYQSQAQQVEILVDGAEVGTFNPPGVIYPAVTTYYTAYQASNFSVTAGTHTVEFLGLSSNTADSTVFIDQVTIIPVVDTLMDGGFEQPSLPLNGYATDPGGSAWQFAGTAGIAKNGSDFVTNWQTAQNAVAGTQVGYVQYNGSISQAVYLDAGTYQVGFLAAQRNIYQSSYQVIEILVDGTPAGTVNPVNDLYGSYTSSTFSVTTGPHTIEFLGLDPQGGDNTVFIDQVGIYANAFNDSSFETPSLAQGSYQTAPTGSAWQFSGTAGIAHDGSGFIANNTNAPDGSQLAFIQGTGAMSQTVNLVAGSYSISFQGAQRGSGQTQQIQVLVDGAQVGLIAPVGTAYNLYQTWSFAATAGMHTIRLVGLNPQGGDNTAVLDEISLAPTGDEIADGGFESPALAANSYQVAPGGSAWQFSGLAGVSTNGSGLTSGTANAPQGSQVGFIMNGGSMSYTAYLDANAYSISFLATQRITNQTQPQTIEVLVDGAQVALITPVSPVNMNGGVISYYTLYQTPNFTVAAGTHTIELLGLSPASGQSAAFLDQVALTTAQNTISDGSFETPVLATDAYAIAPGGSGWQFSGSAGVTADASGFTYVSPGPVGGITYYGDNAPDGVQAAFIKNNGSMSQSVYFEAGTYNISFMAAQRVNFQSQDQQIAVYLDGSQIGSITPATASVANGSNLTYVYTPYQTTNFSVTAGAHTVQFQGLSPSGSDSTAFIDDVSITLGSAISDGGFEVPAMATNAYQFSPAGSSWQFAGAAGISSNYSGFTMGNANAPEGTQVAILKDTGSMSQSVYLDAGLYDLSFEAAQRDTFQDSYQSIAIFVDGIQVGSATPALPVVGTTTTAYGAYQTSKFTVTAGIHTIQFVGVNPQGGDNTAFIDDVALTS